MGWSEDESEKSDAQKDYERGTKDGSQASALDELGRLVTLGFPSSEVYNAGFDDGVQNKAPANSKVAQAGEGIRTSDTGAADSLYTSSSTGSFPVGKIALLIALGLGLYAFVRGERLGRRA